MSSDPSKPERRAFLELLDKVLRSAGLSITDLAKEVGLTRQQLSDLRNSESLPSPAVLRKIWASDKLRKHPIESVRPFVRAQLPELMLRGMGITDLEDAIWDAVREHALDFAKRECKRDANLKTRCIVSNQIGERYDDDLLAATVWQVNQGTKYFYFLPDTSPDREVMLDRVKGQYSGDLALVDSSTYFICAPKVLFVARIRIENIGSPEQESHYSLGRASHPIIFRMQAEEAAAVRDVLLPVVQKAPTTRENGQKEIHVSARDMDLVFELDY